MDIIVARLEKETAEIRVGCLERLLDRGISTDEALSLILTTSEKDHLAAVRRQAHAQAMAAHREEMARLETGRLEMERRLLEIKAALPGPGA